MNTQTAELPKNRITLSLLCPACANRVACDVAADHIPTSLPCSCGNTLSLTGGPEWSESCELGDQKDMKPASA